MTYGRCGAWECGPGWGPRRHFTREERAAWLEDYAQGLEQELKAVRERIGELRKA